jgi:hypothetical protein
MLGEVDVFVVVNAVLHVADPVSWPGEGPLDEVMIASSGVAVARFTQ